MIRKSIGIALLVGVIGGIALDIIRDAHITVYVAEASEPRAAQVLIAVQPAALDAIGDCESGERLADGTAIPGSGRHYQKDGTVVIGQATDPKYGKDVGEYQINTLHHADRAAAMGLDLYDEQDNATYARYLYNRYGTQPWSASRTCWQSMI